MKRNERVRGWDTTCAVLFVSMIGGDFVSMRRGARSRFRVRARRRFVRRSVDRTHDARHPRRTRARTVRGRKSRDATPRTSRSIGTDRTGSDQWDSMRKSSQDSRQRTNERTTDRPTGAVHRDATRYRSVRPSVRPSVVRRPSSFPCRTNRITHHPTGVGS